METQKIQKVNVTKTFKRIMLDKDMKQVDAAAKMGWDKRPYNRLIQKNDELRIREIITIVDGYNCDIKLSFIDRNTGKEWECDYQ